MGGIGGLVPQQIAIRARFIIPLVAYARFFADRERHGTVGILLFDRADDLADHIVGIIRILTAL